MQTVDILAFGAHPDDVELGCSGSISLSISQGKSVAIIDLTKGELGTRGTATSRKEEAQKAAAILKSSSVKIWVLGMVFFKIDEAHQLKLIAKIRAYRPQIVLCNAKHDRHIDHAKANLLVNDLVF
jgi:LmbE family N-acetylglucosaminyl deacetylase